MTRTTHRTARALACVASCMLLAVLFAQASASEETTSAGRGFGFVYDPAHEVTLVGTVKAFVTHHVAGSPMGLHVLISTSGKTVDAHIGPVLSKQVQETMQVGELVQVVGVHENVHGKDVLLARQLIYGGRQVTVRNERGFVVGAASRPEVHYGSGANGGVR
ncbi:MAG TPA: hypothetical protein VK828_14595 [Terriglobales bacterium]|jgi:hypothetical protein|nr:hypothetical protein [Terriglobales bacterium]